MIINNYFQKIVITTIIILTILIPTISAAETLVVYPTVDGVVTDNTASAYLTLRSDTGASATSGSTTAVTAPIIDSSATTNTYHIFGRGVLSFDTSGLPDNTSISSAVFSLYATAKTNGLGSPAFGITGGTLASNTTLAAGDYDGWDSVRYASDIAYASLTTSARNNWSLNTAGIANISNTSYTIIYLRDSYDIDASAPTWSKNSVTSMSWYPVGYATESSRPYLEITYTATPAAAFSANATSGTEQMAVLFTDSSTHVPTSWKWAYKNASVGWTQFSTSQNPTFTFAAGTYDINLTATNAVGSDDEVKVSYITVSEAAVAPVAAFSANATTGTEQMAVLFTDASTNTPTSWNWAYKNASVGWTQFSTSQNPTFTFGAGTYDINLTATNAGGSDDELKTSYITVNVAPPVAVFSANATSGTDPMAVLFTDSSTGNPTSWKWAYKNASVGWTQFSTSQNPTFTFAEGTYDINLTATNAGGSDDELKTSYITVSAGTITPVAAFSANATTGTEQMAVLFTDSSTNVPTSWNWAYKNASVGWTQFSTSQNPTFTFGAGVYDINLTATNAAGSDDELKTSYITVNEPGSAPVAAFHADKTFAGLDEVIHFFDDSTNTPTIWYWEFGDANTSSSQNPTHSYNWSGLFNVSLKATNEFGFDFENKTNYITIGVCDWGECVDQGETCIP